MAYFALIFWSTVFSTQFSMNQLKLEVWPFFRVFTQWVIAIKLSYGEKMTVSLCDSTINFPIFCILIFFILSFDMTS